MGIQNARHALAYHEKRNGFRPEVWEVAEKGDEKRIKQFWFAGDHGDVGGGHRYINGDKSKPITMETDLSVVSLVWMLEEATDLRLAVKMDKFQEYREAAEYMCSNALGSREVNQVRWPWKYLRKKEKEETKYEYIEEHDSLNAYKKGT